MDWQTRIWQSRMGFCLVLCSILVPIAAGQEPKTDPKAKIEFRWIEDALIKDVTEDKGITPWEDDLIFLHKKAILTGKDVAEATLSKKDLTANGLGVLYSVKLRLTEEAKRKLAMEIDKGGRRRLAIVVDGKVRGATDFPNKSAIDTNDPSAGFLSSKAEAERIVEVCK
ncbi:MAG: hypothetical protein JWN70_485 [Planctomycetaceae bacterium]|nr:hypothetical protein [Planctomycetaceae bacterium]